MTNSYTLIPNTQVLRSKIDVFEMTDPVYVYIRQLENAIKYDTNAVKRLYPFRFGEEE